MTEIPEHLLNRAKARRDALAGKTPESQESAPASAPARTEAPAAAKPAPAKAAAQAKPDPIHVRTARERHKIPFWAMAGLALLPLWAFLYLIAMTPAHKAVAGPLTEGKEIYAGCAGCHGGDGAGGAGRPFAAGEVLKTFPQIEDMLNFVYNGSQRFVAAGLKTYGDPGREGGAHAPLSFSGNPMPQQGEKAGGALSEAEILAVVCHVRYDLAGADHESEEWAAEYEHWCSPDSEIFKGLEAGSTSFDTLDKDFSALSPAPAAVGTEPRESKAAK